MIIILMGVCGSGKTTVAEALRVKLGWPIAEADQYHPEVNKRKMAAGIPLTDEDRIPWLLSLRQVIERWLERGIDGIVTCSALKHSYRDILRHGRELKLPLSEEQNNSRPDDSLRSQPTTKDASERPVSIKCRSNDGKSLTQVSALGTTTPTTTIKNVNSQIYASDAKTKPKVYFVFLDGPRDILEERTQNRTGHFMPVSLLNSQLSTLERPKANEENIVTVSITDSLPVLVEKLCEHIIKLNA